MRTFQYFERSESKLLYFQYQEIKEHLRIIGSLIKSCSIGLADAAKLVVLLSKIDSRDFKSSGKRTNGAYIVKWCHCLYNTHPLT